CHGGQILPVSFSARLARSGFVAAKAHSHRRRLAGCQGITFPLKPYTNPRKAGKNRFDRGKTSPSSAAPRKGMGQVNRTTAIALGGALLLAVLIFALTGRG